MDENKRIIEINGIKMEVDLRTAKRIDTFKVGDAVKVLDSGYSNDVKIKPGVIVGFCEFEKSPAIEIMLLNEDYNGVAFKFITITDETTTYEIVHYNNYESLFTQSNVIDKFDRIIEKKNIELEELTRQKKYFIDDFKKAFSEIVPQGGDE